MEPRITEAFPIVYLAIILPVAATGDILSRKIPNWLTFSTMVTGIIYHTWTEGWKGLLSSAAGVAIGLGLLIIFYLSGGMGAGDVKLMGAVGSLVGPKGVFSAFLGTALFGGVYAIVIAMLHGQVQNMIGRYGAMVKTFFYTRQIAYIPASRGEKGPALYYGLAIAFGTLLSVLGRII
ncbi:MAG: prepilin peptidase [bacterium]